MGTQQSLVMDCPCGDRSEAGLGESAWGWKVKGQVSNDLLLAGTFKSKDDPLYIFEVNGKITPVCRSRKRGILVLKLFSE